MKTITIESENDIKKILNEHGDIKIQANLNFINKIDIEIPGCIYTFSGWVNTAGGSIKCEEIDTTYDDNDCAEMGSGDITTCGGNIYVKSLQCGGRLNTGGGDVYVEKDLDLSPGGVRTAGGKIICKGNITFDICGI